MLAEHNARRASATLLHEHAATVFEDFCRNRHPNAARYWESGLEFDFVRQADRGRLIVTEVRWRKLAQGERAQVLQRLKENWAKARLSRRYPNAQFEVLDAGCLAGQTFPCVADPAILFCMFGFAGGGD
jgi:hypothetical protein